MSGDLDRDHMDADLEEQLRGSFQATRVPRAPTAIRERVSELLASEPASRRRTLKGIGEARLVAAALIVIVGVVGTALYVGAPSVSSSPAPTGLSSAPTPRTSGGALAHYAGGGYGFDYPAAWTFYPFLTTGTFGGTIGYLASLPVDTSKIGAGRDRHWYDIRPGNVVIELGNWGMPIDPIQFYDHPQTGARVLVGGMAAVFSEERVAADHVRLNWMIAFPDAFGNGVQVDADILGPEEAQLRQQVAAMILSFAFVPPAVPLPTGQEAALATAARAVADLQAHKPGYECFPSTPGAIREAAVTALGDSVLTKPLLARCSITISRTDVGFWRLELTSSWDAAADRSAGSDTTVQWLFPDGTPSASTGSVAGAIPYCCK